MKLAATLFVAAVSLAGCVDDTVSNGYGAGGIRPSKPFTNNLPTGPSPSVIYAQTIDTPRGIAVDDDQVIALHTARLDGLEDVEIVTLDGTSLCTLVVDSDGGVVDDGCGLE